MNDKYDNTNNSLLLKKYGIPIVIAVVIVFSTLLILDYEEKNIRTELYQNQIEIQQAITDSISKNISAELKLIFLELNILANSNEFQEDFQSQESLSLMNTTFQKINQITSTSTILLTNSNSLVIAESLSQSDSFVNTKLAGFGLKQTLSTLESSISSWAGPRDSGYQIALIHPILDSSQNLLGMLVLSIPAEEFFGKHGNLYDIDARFLVTLDGQHNFITHPNTSLIGQNFYDESIQTLFEYNESFYNHYVDVFQGNSGFALYHMSDNEVIDTGSSIFLDEKHVLSIFVITQTSTLLDRIDEIMVSNKIITIAMLFIIASTLILLFFRRTQTLEKEKLTIIGQLASNIAHDMRNPLGTIKGSARRIKKQNTQENDIINDEIDRINRSIQRMSHQVEQVLNYVRITPIILEKSSINEILQNSLDSVTIPDNVKLTSSIDDVVLECDPEKLEIVFVNILINAIQAIGTDNSTVSIRLDETTNDIKIEFENSGPNISENDIPKIFDPLFTTKLSGTGLGLSGCKNIIEQHGGSIKVTSNPVIFTITLPKIQRKKSHF